jgi:hypothetical protein
MLSSGRWEVFTLQAHPRLTVLMTASASVAHPRLCRMAKHMLADDFEQYRGEAINPKHLSIWES